MRINFAGSYKEVSRLLRAPSKPAEVGRADLFEQKLSQITPKQSTKLEISRDVHYDEQLGTDARARFSFDQASLELPSLTPQPPVEPEPVPAAKDDSSVKTPTLLRVQRVDLGAVTNTSLSSKEEIVARLKEIGEKFGVDPNLAKAVVHTESGFNPKAVSSDGHASKGLFQLLDSTGKDLLSRLDRAEQSYDPFNPDLNIELGTSYLRYLHDIFRTPTTLSSSHVTAAVEDPDTLEKFAVAAFNAGEGRVASAQKRAAKLGKNPASYRDVEPHLPASTRQYVARVSSAKKSEL
jgi:soluble lytic murein transglycosylase-like protein